MNRNWLAGGAIAAALTAFEAPRAQEFDATSPRPRPEELMAPEPAGFEEADLDVLVAPIALYPDALLTQIFVAATFPLDVVKADRFIVDAGAMSDRDRAAAAANEPWDPSVQFLAGGFPAVVRKMAQDLDWTEQLGDAVIAQTDDVLDAVQRMRAQAAATGNLATNEAQVVEVNNGAITVSPADPQTIYVPAYDPALAFASTPPVVVQDSGTSDLLVMGAVSFGTALLVNEIFDDDDNWDDYWGPGHAHIDWDDAEFYPRRDVDIDGDVNIDIDRTRIEGGDGRIGDGEVRREARRKGRETGGWEPTVEQRERAQSSIERRQGDRTGAGAAAAGIAGGALAARSQGGGEARARLEAANAKRPPAQKFDGSASILQPRKDTPVRANKSRERGAASLEGRHAAPAKARLEGVDRPKSVSKPAQVKKPVRKPPQASSAFKKQGAGSRPKASSSRGARSAGGRAGGGPRGRR